MPPFPWYDLSHTAFGVLHISPVTGELMDVQGHDTLPRRFNLTYVSERPKRF